MDREKGTCIGVIVCRLEPHGHSARNRGYIAMLAVSKEYRKRKIGSTLVLMAIEAMKSSGADEVKHAYRSYNRRREKEANKDTVTFPHSLAHRTKSSNVF